MSVDKTLEKRGTSSDLQKQKGPSVMHTESHNNKQNRNSKKEDLVNNNNGKNQMKDGGGGAGSGGGGGGSERTAFSVQIRDWFRSLSPEERSGVASFADGAFLTAFLDYAATPSSSSSATVAAAGGSRQHPAFSSRTVQESALVDWGVMVSLSEFEEKYTNNQKGSSSKFPHKKGNSSSVAYHGASETSAVEKLSGNKVTEKGEKKDVDSNAFRIPQEGSGGDTDGGGVTTSEQFLDFDHRILDEVGVLFPSAMKRVAGYHESRPRVFIPPGCFEKMSDEEVFLVFDKMIRSGFLAFSGDESQYDLHCWLRRLGDQSSVPLYSLFLARFEWSILQRFLDSRKKKWHSVLGHGAFGHALPKLFSQYKSLIDHSASADVLSLSRKIAPLVEVLLPSDDASSLTKTDHVQNVLLVPFFWLAFAQMHRPSVDLLELDKAVGESLTRMDDLLPSASKHHSGESAKSRGKAYGAVKTSEIAEESTSKQPNTPGPNGGKKKKKKSKKRKGKKNPHSQAGDQASGRASSQSSGQQVNGQPSGHQPSEQPNGRPIGSKAVPHPVPFGGGKLKSGTGKTKSDATSTGGAEAKPQAGGTVPAPLATDTVSAETKPPAVKKDIHEAKEDSSIDSDLSTHDGKPPAASASDKSESISILRHDGRIIVAPTAASSDATRSETNDSTEGKQEKQGADDGHAWETVEARSRINRKKPPERSHHGSRHSHHSSAATPHESHGGGRKSKGRTHHAKKRTAANRKMVRDILCSVFDAVVDAAEEARKRRQNNIPSPPRTVNSWKNGPPGAQQRSSAPRKDFASVVAKAAPKEQNMRDVVAKAAPKESTMRDVVAKVAPKESTMRDIVAKAAPKELSMRDVVAKAAPKVVQKAAPKEPSMRDIVAKAASKEPSMRDIVAGKRPPAQQYTRGVPANARKDDRANVRESSNKHPDRHGQASPPKRSNSLAAAVVADQNTAPTYQETVSAISVSSNRPPVPHASLKNGKDQKSDPGAGPTDEALQSTGKDVATKSGVMTNSSPPLPTLLSPENANSASSSVASSLEAPHARHHHHRSATVPDVDEVGYHLLDVCDKLSRDLGLFMNRRALALHERRRERGALLSALQESVSSIWPGTCQVELYGSCATQLDLPSSDMDVVILGLDRNTSLKTPQPVSAASFSKSASTDSIGASVSLEETTASDDVIQMPPQLFPSSPYGMLPMHLNSERVVRLASELEGQSWAVQVNAIPTATVPVIKVLADPSRLSGSSGNSDWVAQHGEEESGEDGPNSQNPYGQPPVLPWRGSDVMQGLLSLDITFEGPEHGGIGSTEFSSRAVAAACRETGLHPDATPFVQVLMVVKELLAQRKLNEPYSGGLSSYAALLLVVALLRERAVITEEIARVEEHKRAMAAGEFQLSSQIVHNEGASNEHFTPPNNQSIPTAPAQESRDASGNAPPEKTPDQAKKAPTTPSRPAASSWATIAKTTKTDTPSRPNTEEKRPPPAKKPSFADAVAGSSGQGSKSAPKGNPGAGGGRTGSTKDSVPSSRTMKSDDVQRSSSNKKLAEHSVPESKSKPVGSVEGGASSEGAPFSTTESSLQMAPIFYPQGYNDIVEVLCSGETTAGKLLMHFLLFYGQHFDAQSTAIDISGKHERDFADHSYSYFSPYIQRRAPGSIDPRTGMWTVDPIVIYDPLEGAEHNNVAKRCFAWNSVRWIFAQSYATLASAVERSATPPSTPSGPSQLNDDGRGDETSADLYNPDAIHDLMDPSSPLLRCLLSF